MPNAQPSQVILKYSEPQLKAAVEQFVHKAFSELQATVKANRDETDKLLAESKRARIQAFCEAHSKKILPAELDGTSGKPTLIDRLMRADARATVRKFSEGGKEVTQTELDLQMAEIAARPDLVTFAERVAQTKPGKVSADEEKAKVETHFEKFSEDFSKMGTTKKQYIDRYERLQKNGGMTADQYIGAKAS